MNSDGLGQRFQVLLGGHRDGDRPLPVGVAIQADVLHQGVSLELRLHFAQGHVLAELRGGGQFNAFSSFSTDRHFLMGWSRDVVRNSH